MTLISTLFGFVIIYIFTCYKCDWIERLENGDRFQDELCLNICRCSYNKPTCIKTQNDVQCIGDYDNTVNGDACLLKLLDEKQIQFIAASNITNTTEYPITKVDGNAICGKTHIPYIVPFVWDRSWKLAIANVKASVDMKYSESRKELSVKFIKNWPGVLMKLQVFCRNKYDESELTKKDACVVVKYEGRAEDPLDFNIFTTTTTTTITTPVPLTTPLPATTITTPKASTTPIKTKATTKTTNTYTSSTPKPTIPSPVKWIKRLQDGDVCSNNNCNCPKDKTTYVKYGNVEGCYESYKNLGCKLTFSNSTKIKTITNQYLTKEYVIYSVCKSSFGIILSVYVLDNGWKNVNKLFNKYIQFTVKSFDVHFKFLNHFPGILLKLHFTCATPSNENCIIVKFEGTTSDPLNNDIFNTTTKAPNLNTTFKLIPSTSVPVKSDNVLLLVGVITAVCILMLFIILIVCWCIKTKRQKRKRRTTDENIDTADTNNGNNHDNSSITQNAVYYQNTTSCEIPRNSIHNDTSNFAHQTGPNFQNTSNYEINEIPMSEYVNEAHEYQSIYEHLQVKYESDYQLAVG